MERFKENVSNLDSCDLKTVGGRIRFCRLRRNLTQEELSETSGLKITTIMNFENNKTNHTLQSINKIADALKIKPSFIYDDYLNFISGDFVSKIKTIRINMKLTRKEFNDLIEKNRISDWELGRTIPSRKTYCEIKNKIKTRN